MWITNKDVIRAQAAEETCGNSGGFASSSWSMITMKRKWKEENPDEYDEDDAWGDVKRARDNIQKYEIKAEEDDDQEDYKREFKYDESNDQKF